MKFKVGDRVKTNKLMCPVSKDIGNIREINGYNKIFVNWDNWGAGMDEWEENELELVSDNNKNIM